MGYQIEDGDARDAEKSILHHMLDSRSDIDHEHPVIQHLFDEEHMHRESASLTVEELRVGIG